MFSLTSDLETANQNEILFLTLSDRQKRERYYPGLAGGRGKACSRAAGGAPDAAMLKGCLVVAIN